MLVFNAEKLHAKIEIYYSLMSNLNFTQKEFAQKKILSRWKQDFSNT
jgi:hypothetical protein